MLTAGALALAVLAPALDSAEHAVEAVQALPAQPAIPESSAPAVAESLAAPGSLAEDLDREGEPAAALAAPGGFDEDLYRERQSAATRATRAMQRRTVRPASLVPLQVRPAVAPLLHRSVPSARRSLARAGEPRFERGMARAQPARKAVRASQRRTAVQASQQRMAVRASQRRVTVAQRRTTVSHRGMVRKTARRTAVRSQRVSSGRRIGAVLAYARSQVGRRYVAGGEGRAGFDCSGLTRQAYARAGMRLPHSSSAQAARARTIPRWQARPGDLVVGQGHVGIYMGRGMMIDAGNRHTGVVYRKLYGGLQVKRIPGP
ncbi:Cell wall-associated hydrolase, NlpC family [Actinoplanes regularis]|uniref:Cell wall-associated hydrolase, NlpC family n=1 Tax=Actinoplanes regularis TaxID=52697 RepID=A0A239AYD5_9ACTN|nr:hydrolase [Actinoplanes regularis]SNS00746.1 Cell wall-associated hydrolase, NlpC family [Actinoplanes regularis]